ncbi:MAG: CopG family transcriptional regulator [Thauera sp.]|jgi:hypothetical protein|nr:MAG: CopG family transcriptional regulator [Thauera sp.]
MPSETSDLPDDPRPRVAAAAKRAGNAADAFTIEALVEKSGRVEQGACLNNEAEDRYARIVASGGTIPWQELRRYLIAHIAGAAIPLPAPRTLMR